MKKTCLYNQHIALGAKMFDFAGYAMPLQYTSQIKEHAAVRHDVGIFDVSHMVVFDIHGPQSRDFLEYLLPCNFARLKLGQGMYGCLLNETAGIVDDVLVYQLPDFYRLVSNCATFEGVFAHLHQHIESFNAHLVHRDDLGMLAIQGPSAPRIASEALQQFHITAMPRFGCEADQNLFYARTGYTGADGFELIASVQLMRQLWDKFVAAGALPCGFGARDILRLEAGLLLSGVDMGPNTTPAESRLSWLIDWSGSRDFIGQKSLYAQKETPKTKLYYGMCDERRMPRSGQPVLNAHNQTIGHITSSVFSPFFKKAVCMLRLFDFESQNCFTVIGAKTVGLQVLDSPCFVKGKYQDQLK